ncbi:type II toxin-antitoxin system RelE/ParE family toxin [Parapedobacter sp. SGR-10]|uniref:type II toxin-antitoxin system RelE/ParE family toxin n=1 Tax=Parapedobacter sp. SGR-10 TaxID=2710879 RepID=UPI0013D1F9F6|nr:type II toxin-antitoxin system RelE/ParE family toxin [Parapedobacter sp. SGR-10]NGF57943.1 type II toxin-antitoxin system RelE/ParE family toxin [Parapedobacter sp. SGR-10]
MGLIIYWTDFAKKELKNIFDYHKEKVSLKIAKQIAKQVVEKANCLSSFPEIGPIEQLLKERPQNFRHIVSTNYKIVYWINNDKNRVEIVDIFDTRQNPEKITRKK